MHHRDGNRKLLMTSLLLASSRTMGFLMGRHGRVAATRPARGASGALCSTASTASMGLRVDTPEAMELLGSAFAVGTQPGDVICLSGDLGAGKTCFSRGFVRARLGDARMRVTSPSYLLDQTYDCATDDGSSHFEIHHMDLYRLSGGADLSALNLPNLLFDAICLLEWPDRLGDLMPESRVEIDIRIENLEEDIRTVKMHPTGDRWEGLVKAAIETYESGVGDLVIEEDNY